MTWTIWLAPGQMTRPRSSTGQLPTSVRSRSSCGSRSV